MPKPPIGKKQGKFTYGDYCTWGEDERWELIEGVPYDITPAPLRVHSTIAGGILKQLLPFFDGKSCEVHFAPFDVRLPKGKEGDEKVDTVVQPDILVVCDEKKLDEKGCRGAPDLVIEIFSPSSASRDAVLKRRIYEKHGVREYWTVDPANRIVYLYSRTESGEFGKMVVFGDADVIKDPLFPGLEIDLKRVFPKLPPRVVKESPRKYL